MSNPLKLPQFRKGLHNPETVELTQEQCNTICKIEEQIQVEMFKMLERLGVKVDRDDGPETIKLRMQLNNVEIVNATFIDSSMDGWYFYKGKQPVAVIYYPAFTPDKDGRNIPAIRIMTPEMCAAKLSDIFKNQLTVKDGAEVKRG